MVGRMTPLHAQEKEQFRKLFQQERVENFEDRFKVLEAFLSMEKHVTVDELAGVLDNRGAKLSAEFVRDTLKMLSRLGFARQSRFDNGVARYEHHHLGDHHDHMICTKCSRIIEFKEDRLEKYQIQIAASHGFHMLRHKMEIYGICAECLKERSRQMPLTMAKAGERLVIREVSGGASVRMRLLSMGLRQGDRIEIITNDGQGQLAIAADLKRYALGRGLAQKIIVESSER
jgi:Fur family transcriptional regulator, ferric uptake regulator